ncbi:MAG: DUF5916 domain-containing protein [Bacteroidota bacterium]
MSRLSLVMVSCLLSVQLFAQSERPNQSSHRLDIQRANSEIRLDGVLDEAAWKAAAVAGDFWEKDPRDDVKSVVQTEGRLTYDDQFLYVAITCFDTSTNHVIQTLKRDVGYWDSDAVAITLDPINEAANGFMFGVNPLGVQMEALLGGGSGPGNWNNNWDNIWYAETAQYEDRWVVEMAIPFKTLRYEAGAKIWGINFLRNDAKRNRFHVWAPIPRQFWGIDQGYSGQLVWDKEPPVASGNVAIIPYISGQFQQDMEAEVPDEKEEWLGQAGVDAKIALSPSLNLDLTVNPDFSQVDVDVQQTNLTRFNLFFPERRNFFLENSDMFTSFGIPPARPFFSRRIGLDEDGQAVPITFGARLTGNVTDDLRIGVLGVQTKANDVQAGQNYFTAAFSQRVLERSSIRGMFINRQAFANGEFSDTDYNRNADLEFNYQSADGSIEGWAGYHHAFRQGVDDKQVFWNTGGAYTGANFNFLVDYVTVGENYFADVGFVNRLENYDAVRDTTIRRGYKILYTPLNFTLLPQVDWLQNLNINLENALFLNDDYSLNERITAAIIVAEFPNSSRLEFGTVNYTTDLLFPFDFTDGEPLPAGRYNYQDFGINYNSDQRKLLSYGLQLEGGGFYNGRRTLVGGNLNYRVQPWGSFALSANYNQLTFPDNFGEETLWLIGPRAEVNFSKNLFWTTFLQYNTQADNFNINSRLQWQFRPLSWLFLVYSDNYAVDVWGPKNRALVLKVNYWLVL